ncbi:hypothetical protein KKE45_02530 [Patescibacteria group bacterium]|nr:hypothetical protein [Patescibacteria group bacterium]
MSRKKIKKVTKLSKYEWMIYAKSYLKMAEVGLEELRCKKYVKKGLDHMFFYKQKWLLIPIIWNLKHALELAVKTLGIGIDKQYLQSHDSGKLAKNLLQTIKKLNIINDLKPKTIQRFAEIIFKYYRCEFWDKKFIKTDTVLDIQNDIFRYPENTASFQINLQILQDIPFNEENGYSHETEELSQDIKELGNLFGALNNRIRNVMLKKIK